MIGNKQPAREQQRRRTAQTRTTHRRGELARREGGVGAAAPSPQIIVVERRKQGRRPIYSICGPREQHRHTSRGGGPIERWMTRAVGVRHRRDSWGNTRRSIRPLTVPLLLLRSLCSLCSHSGGSAPPAWMRTRLWTAANRNGVGGFRWRRRLSLVFFCCSRCFYSVSFLSNQSILQMNNL